jgi:hypothetical protein
MLQMHQAGLSRVAVTWPKNMLHDARMAGSGKLHRSDGRVGE